MTKLDQEYFLDEKYYELKRAYEKVENLWNELADAADDYKAEFPEEADSRLIDTIEDLLDRIVK